MNVEYKWNDGSIVITDIINNQYVHCKYMGYTEEEAKEKFAEKHYPKTKTKKEDQ